MAKNRLSLDPRAERYLLKERVWGSERPARANPPSFQPNWQAAFKAVLEKLAEKLAEKVAGGRLEILERDMLAVNEHCKRLRDGQSFLVPMETLAPEPFLLKRPLHVVVRPTDGEYQATLFDANIGMTGDTAEEAVSNLKQLIVDIFEQLECNEASLGPAAIRQLAALREFLQKQG